SDMNLSALIFKMANSSFYSRGRQIDSFKHAIAILGFNVIKTIAIAAASEVLFLSDSNPVYRRLIWSHSLVTGILSRVLGKEFPKQEKDFDAEKFFLSGLFHDIGKVVLNYFDRKNYHLVIAEVEENPIDFPESEKKHVDTTHVEAGILACDAWGLPTYVKDVIADHESPFQEGEPANLSYVRAANFLSKHLGYGKEVEEEKEQFFQTMAHISGNHAYLDNGEEELNSLCTLVNAKLSKDPLFQYFHAGESA
ncbi:MAG: HDOD domain-containing protein, partial [Candidatus Hydrogenedentota bacterium]